ncbi:hypothetical protein D7Y13_17175 [Corallococcus praedator]|uniref:Uncharacterized protein n=1 Tax=Corallococcus praedator TaxID=2316724 RepID=A0ABX9QIN1_9BACT|nr:MULTISPECIES: hypothetical protein [Corallococcus]RKH33439.1 hypothetical protein D7X75_11995 [Corallococcus sp. CA031C]RKI07782.1 hypothetical protein D7Y13_17175 [Corallococcus praedator]
MKAISSVAAAAALFVSVPALAGHSIQSTHGLSIVDNGASSPATGVNMAITWNESTLYAYASFSGIANGNSYDFNLVGSSVTAVTASNINGLWNIHRNGVLICGGCTGSAYGLTAGVGSGIKFYTSGEVYGFSAYVDSRQDY